MKTRLAFILVVLALLASALLLVWIFNREPPPPDRYPPLEVPKPRPLAASPREAVVAYMEALYRRDFRAAYEYLSARSKETHPYEEFAGLCEGGEATNYDLAGAQQEPPAGGHVTVTVPLVEDPATAGFTTVREDDDWKVIFIGGAPWFPYP